LYIHGAPPEPVLDDYAHDTEWTKHLWVALEELLEPLLGRLAKVGNLLKLRTGVLAKPAVLVRTQTMPRCRRLQVLAPGVKDALEVLIHLGILEDSKAAPGAHRPV
jgi:hypothetical protein